MSTMDDHDLFPNEQVDTIGLDHFSQVRRLLLQVFGDRVLKEELRHFPQSGVAELEFTGLSAHACGIELAHMIE